MRLRVALHAVAGPRGGPRTYAASLAQALARRDELDLTVLTDRPDAFPGLSCIELPRPVPVTDQLVLPGLLGKLAPDVYHNTKNVLPLLLPCPSVVTIHDLACLHHPETFTAPARAYLRFHTRHAASRATRIVAVSHHARRDLMKTLRVPEARVRVIHHGVAEAFRAPAGPPPADLRRPYVLSVGTIQARKNLDVLVRAVARVRARGLDANLAIAGRRGWRTEAFDEACRTTPVQMLGVVDDARLPALYAHAAAFAQPSSYEGFGLTVAEAMAAGAPVVAADAGSLPEIVGEAGLLVPPRDEEALAKAIEQLLRSDALRAELAAAGRRRAASFDWDRSAEQHARLYRELARRGAPA